MLRNSIVILFFALLSATELYVALQMLDQVGIVDSESMELVNTIEIEIIGSSNNCTELTSELPCNTVDGCEWSMGMCMESGAMMGSHTPHFTAIDEINGYWFVTTIASGYIIRYDLITNQIIDEVFVGDSPALMTLNKIDKKLYCSRMMPMGDMMSGAVSTLVQEIDYSGSMMINTQEFEIPSPAPHGLSINSSGSEIYVASNTADWIYKIMIENNAIVGEVMDLDINNPPDLITQRLKPIQCLSISDSLLFITCSGGIWSDPWTGEQDQIPGQIQLWNSNTMQLIGSHEYDWTSAPWHMINSPNSNHIYVVLSGDQLYEGSAGVSKLAYSGLGVMTEEWYSTNELFNTLHGIDISHTGHEIYVSGRGDGYLHTIETIYGDLLHSVPLANNLSMIMSGGVAANYEPYILLGDINFDGIVEITDIVSLISFILFNLEIVPLAEYNGDYNQDNLINILDVISMVQLILNN